MRRFPAALLALLVGGCDPQLYGRDKKVEEPAETPDDDDGDDGDDEPSPAFGSPLGAFGALGKLSERKRFDDLRESEKYQGGSKYAAVLELDGRVSELGNPLAMFGDGPGTELRRLTLRLQELDADDDVDKILLRLDGVKLSAAVAEELAGIVSGLQSPVHCHTDAAENLDLVLLASCDRVSVAPQAVLALTGPVLTPLYLRGLLDLLGVEPDFIPVGAYKGAGETFMRRDPSPEMRETYDALLDGLFLRMRERIAAGRKADPAKVAAWFDQGLFTAEQAREAGLVDEIVAYPAWRDATAPEGAWKKVKVDEREPGMVFMQLLGGAGPKPVKVPHVAVVYAIGEIRDGDGAGAGPWGEITSGRLVPALRVLAADENVKAVVLRIDSPGGSALASEQIWRELSAIAEKKVVVVSMGQLAASGGYYIATPARRIFAQPDTFTGSIGVIGGKFVVGPALAKVGVQLVEMSRGKRAGLTSVTRKWTADERGALLAMMRDIYETFAGHVAAGRKLSREDVEKIAQGRVWNGKDALDRKLVDELGGLEEAIAYARTEAKVPADAPLELYPGEPTLQDLVAAIEQSFGLPLPIGIDAALWRALPAEAQRLMHLAAGFTSGSPVRAVSLIATP